MLKNNDGLNRQIPPTDKIFPRTLFVSLWFPLSSETFIFYELDGLHKRKLPISVITLYAGKTKNLAEHIKNTDIPIESFGMRKLAKVLGSVFKRLYREPRKTCKILYTLMFRRWRDTEMHLENAWAAVSGFYMAERCKDMNIQHIHAVWGNGPATAAWVVNQLDNIPFSFSVHAGDIRPPDGFLAEKLQDCTFVRANIRFNIPYLQSFVPQEMHDKLYLVYNVATLTDCDKAPVKMQKPFQLIAIGRLIETKGFQYLIEAVHILSKEGIEVHLSIIGSGLWQHRLEHLIAKHKLTKQISMLGFVTHDSISDYIMRSDVLVMPSIVKEKRLNSDGLPNVVMEAMHHSLPVIGTNIAGMCEAVIDNETGLLVPEKDAHALAIAIKKTIEDRENALRMAQNAKQLVEKMFDSDANLDKLSHLITVYT